MEEAVLRDWSFLGCVSVLFRNSGFLYRESGTRVGGVLCPTVTSAHAVLDAVISM